jgi:REP element-mobilizing transposase RayT
MRLQSYDYRTPGLYHVVICTQHHESRFGGVSDSTLFLNEIGEMVIDVWSGIPRHYEDVALDAMVVMPNHVHGIVWIDPEATERAPALGDVVKWFKSITTSRYSDGVHRLGWAPYDGRLWQRNYYDHIVRDERDLERIRLYIEHNPATWEDDDLHPTLGRLGSPQAKGSTRG